MTLKSKRVFLLSLAGFLILILIISLSDFLFKNPPKAFKSKEDFYFTRITKIIDGDTVEIEGGIGLDTLALMRLKKESVFIKKRRKEIGS